MRDKLSGTAPDRQTTTSADRNELNEIKENIGKKDLDELFRFVLFADQSSHIDLTQRSEDASKDVPFGASLPQKVKYSSSNLYKGAGLGLLILAILTGAFFYLASLAQKTTKPSRLSHEARVNTKTPSKQLDVASVYLQIGNLEKAENEIRNTLKADSENARAYKLLGDLYSKKNQRQLALDYYQKAVSLQPSFYQPLLELAIIHEGSKSLSEAVKYYQQASHARPKELTPHLRLANLYNRAGLKEEALKEYRQCLTLNLDGPIAQEIQQEVTQITKFLKTRKGASPAADVPSFTDKPTTLVEANLNPTESSRQAAELLELKSQVSLPPAVTDASQPTARPETAPPTERLNYGPPPSIELAAKIVPKLPSPEPRPPLPSQSQPAPPTSTTEPATPLYAPPQIKAGDIVPAQEVDSPPLLVKKPDPRIPTEAENFSGTAMVLLMVLISEKGEVINTRVISRPAKDLGFSQAAEEAVRKWRYQPAIKNGVKVKVWRTVQVNFRL